MRVTARRGSGSHRTTGISPGMGGPPGDRVSFRVIWPRLLLTLGVSRGEPGSARSDIPGDGKPVRRMWDT